MRKFLILLFLLSLCSCGTYQHTFLTPSQNGLSKGDWNKYGAVYEYNELLVTTQASESSPMFLVSFEVNQMIHILSEKGLQYAKFDFKKIIRPRYIDAKLVKLDIAVYDTAGRRIDIDQDQILNKFRKTGYIVVPKVEVGRKIAVRAILQVFKPIMSYEYWFPEDIPVIKGKLTWVSGRFYAYMMAGYGKVVATDQVKKSAYSVQSWIAENVLPSDSEEPIQRYWKYNGSPRVLVKLTHFAGTAYNMNWDDYAKSYLNEFLNESVFASTQTIRTVVERETAGANTEWEKADRLLQYVQDNITEDGTLTAAVHPDAVVKNGKGNKFEISLLLQRLFETAGFKAHVIATRPHNMGGFDPKIPDWHFLIYPAVVVEINGKGEFAYPFARGVALGECPFTLNNLKGLDIERGKIVSLPKPKGTLVSMKSYVRLSDDAQNETVKWQLSFCNDMAMMVRLIFNHITNEAKKNFSEKLIKEFDKFNELKTVSYDGIENRGLEIHAQCRVSNTTYKTVTEKKRHVSLAPFFRSFFSDYNPGRIDNYATYVTQRFEETVEISKNEYPDPSISFKCVDLENQLFQSECRRTESNTGIIVSRVVTVKECDLPPAEMMQINAEIQQLNQIDESFLTQNK